MERTPVGPAIAIILGTAFWFAVVLLLAVRLVARWV